MGYSFYPLDIILFSAAPDTPSKGREDEEPQPDPDQLFISTRSYLKFLNSSAMTIVCKLVFSRSLGLFDGDKFQAYIKTIS